MVHIPHQVAKVLYGDLPCIHSVDGDRALHDIIEAWDQIHQRGLPRARVTDEGDSLPLVYLEIDLPKHPLLSVAEGDVV